MDRLRATFILPLKQEVFSGVALVNSETYFDKFVSRDLMTISESGTKSNSGFKRS